MSGASGMPGEIAPGHEFGNFAIEGVLGRGAMGIVYEARDIQLGRRVALKVVAAHLAADDGFRARFISEARAAATVEHPGIITVYSAGEVGGTPFIAMRLIDGVDLGTVLAQRGPLPLLDALRILAPIASGLDAAAKAGIVHRDVKPSNIMVPRDGSGAVLVDFGVGRIKGTTRATQSGSWIGTADYVAPEQIRGDDADGRADQYALACVLYELVSGEPPFHRQDTIQTLWAHVNEDPQPLATPGSGISEAQDEALKRAMAKDPADRFDTVFGLIESMSAGMSTDSAGTVPPSAPTSTEGQTGGPAGDSETPPPQAVAEPKSDPPVERTATVVPNGSAGKTAPQSGQAAPPSTRSERGTSSKRNLAIAGVLAAIAIAGGAFALTRGGGDASDPADAAPVAAATVAEPASDMTDAGDDVDAAQKAFSGEVRRVAKWRSFAQRTTDEVTIAQEACKTLATSGERRSCMDARVSQQKVRKIGGWLDGASATLRDSYEVASSDPDFANEQSACKIDALAAVSAASGRAQLLQTFIRAVLSDNADAWNTALEKLNAQSPAFDATWGKFRKTCPGL